MQQKKPGVRACVPTRGVRACVTQARTPSCVNAQTKLYGSQRLTILDLVAADHDAQVCGSPQRVRAEHALEDCLPV
jgi:hypothetical protein